MASVEKPNGIVDPEFTLIKVFPTPYCEKSNKNRSLYSCVADAVADGVGSSLGVRTSTKKLCRFRYDSVIKYCDSLRKLQRHSVSNAVSSAKEFERTPANLSGQKVLRFREIWMSESGGEQEIWA